MTENSDMTDISIDSISASLGIASFLNEQAISAAVAYSVQLTAGILTLDMALQSKCRDLGATFIATEIDVTLFAKGMRASARASQERLQK